MNPTDDILNAFFGGSRATRGDYAHAQQRASRRQCEQTGHRYQVHGKTNPTSLSCSRCRVSWAIGARTEPSEAAS